jgi:hypothetical protein
MCFMTDRPLAEFPLALFEYRAVFEQPVFAAFERPMVIADALFAAFREWNLLFENITLRSLPMTANDLQVACDLLNKRVTFTVSVGGISLLVTNPNWTEAPLIRNIMQRGLVGAEAGAKGVIKELIATQTMHVKAPGKSVQELTARFRPNVGGPGMQKEVKGFGFCIYGQEISWLVDLSALYSDAIFVRIIRIFGPSISFEEIAAALYKDEIEIFDLLGLRIE